MAAPARARWSARGRGRRRAPVPRRPFAGRFPRRRPVLRPVGLPHHVVAAARRRRRRRPTAGVLGAALPATASSSVRADRRRRLRCVDARDTSRPRRRPSHRRLVARLHGQLALHRRGQRLLGVVRPTVDVRPSLEPRHRGAVLCRVATRRARGVEGEQAALSAAQPPRRLAGWSGRVVPRDAGPLRAWFGPDAGLHGHRHPGRFDPCRGGDGDGARPTGGAAGHHRSRSPG